MDCRGDGQDRGRIDDETDREKDEIERDDDNLKTRETSWEY